MYFDFFLVITLALFYCLVSMFLLNSPSIIFLILAIEVILITLALTSAYVSCVLDDLMGLLIALYILPLAGCESAIALSLLVAYYSHYHNLTLN